MIRTLLSSVTVAYFKEITVKGKNKLKNTAHLSSVIFTANHPSGLIDPLVLMHVTRGEFKYVSSVAKHSLFKTPLVGFIIKVSMFVEFFVSTRTNIKIILLLRCTIRVCVQYR